MNNVNLENIDEETYDNENYELNNYCSNRCNGDFFYEFKLYYRIFKRNIQKYIRKKSKENFTNIVCVSVDCPIFIPKSEKLTSPSDFIFEIRKQYPEINAVLLIPLIGLEESDKFPKTITFENKGHFYDFKKTSIDFEFFARNKTYKAVLYKTKDESNTTVYGICSPVFSSLKNASDLLKFENEVLLARSLRIAVQRLNKDNFKPDIVQVDTIPFFIGNEFELKFPSSIKVFQIFDDIMKQDKEKQAPFWAYINMADKNSLKKLFKDEVIKKYLSKLFDVPIEVIQTKYEKCLNLIYKNYNIFTTQNAETSENMGDIIFKRLNDRVKALCPNFIKKEHNYYYPILSAIKNSDFWAVKSKTYYSSLFEQDNFPKELIKPLVETTEKSSYIMHGINTENYIKEIGRSIYNNFDNNNYRNERIKNKQILLKEFSSERLNFDFIDKTLFKEDSKICGYLDSFYEAPLLFANPDSDSFGEGQDILFNSIFKLFERNRNIQIIINIKNGSKIPYVKSIIDFLLDNRIYMGRWVFIDGEINLPKIFSASDMFLVTSRYLNSNMKHLLGMHYGCIPIVPKSGFYNDTVVDIYDNLVKGNGFKTKKSLLMEDENTNIYIETLEKALDFYEKNPSSWNIIIKNCFNTEIGWNFKKLEKYNKIYQELI